MVPLRFRVAHADVDSVTEAVGERDCRVLDAGERGVEFEVNVESAEWEAVAHRIQSIGGVTISVGYPDGDGPT